MRAITELRACCSACSGSALVYQGHSHPELSDLKVVKAKPCEEQDSTSSVSRAVPSFLDGDVALFLHLLNLFTHS